MSETDTTSESLSTGRSNSSDAAAESGDEPNVRGRAIALLEPRHLRSWWNLNPTMALQLRTQFLLRAYKDLKARNNQVRGRLHAALFLMGVAFVLVSSAFVVYIWVMTAGAGS